MIIFWLKFSNAGFKNSKIVTQNKTVEKTTEKEYKILDEKFQFYDFGKYLNFLFKDSKSTPVQLWNKEGC